MKPMDKFLITAAVASAALYLGAGRDKVPLFPGGLRDAPSSGSEVLESAGLDGSFNAVPEPPAAAAAPAAGEKGISFSGAYDWLGRKVSGASQADQTFSKLQKAGYGKTAQEIAVNLFASGRPSTAAELEGWHCGNRAEKNSRMPAIMHGKQKAGAGFQLSVWVAPVEDPALLENMSPKDIAYTKKFLPEPYDVRFPEADVRHRLYTIEFRTAQGLIAERIIRYRADGSEFERLYSVYYKDVSPSWE